MDELIEKELNLVRLRDRVRHIAETLILDRCNFVKYSEFKDLFGEPNMSVYRRGYLSKLVREEIESMSRLTLFTMMGKGFKVRHQHLGNIYIKKNG